MLVGPPISSPRYRPISASDSFDLATSDHSGNAGKISAKDHVLLIVNPFADVIECSVSADGWEHTISLPGPICRPVAIGSSKSLHLVCRIAPDEKVIEDRTFDVPGGSAALHRRRANDVSLDGIAILHGRRFCARRFRAVG